MGGNIKSEFTWELSEVSGKDSAKISIVIDGVRQQDSNTDEKHFLLKSRLPE